MKNDNNRQYLVLIICLLLLLVAVVGATYAFFSVTAQVTEQSLYVENANPLGLIYDGSGVLSLENAIPGDRTAVKTFTIENPTVSAVNQYYTLSLHIDNNGFTQNHVQDLNNPNDTEDNESASNQLLLRVGYGNCEVDETSDNPLYCDYIGTYDLTDGSSSMQAGVDVPIYNAIIEPEETQTYYTYIEFVDTGANQDENRNASFSGHIALTDSILLKNEHLPYNGLSLDKKVKKAVDPNHLNRVAQYLNTFTSSASMSQQAPGIDKTSFSDVILTGDGEALARKIQDALNTINFVDINDTIRLDFLFNPSSGGSASFGIVLGGSQKASIYLANYSGTSVSYSFNYDRYISSIDNNSWWYYNPSQSKIVSLTDEEREQFVGTDIFSNMTSIFFSVPTQYKTENNIRKALEICELAFGITITVPDDLEIGPPSDNKFAITLQFFDINTGRTISLAEDNFYFMPVKYYSSNGNYELLENNKIYLTSNSIRLENNSYILGSEGNNYYSNPVRLNANSNTYFPAYLIPKSDATIVHLNPQLTTPNQYVQRDYSIAINWLNRTGSQRNFDRTMFYNIMNMEDPKIYLIKGGRYTLSGYNNTTVQEFTVPDEDEIQLTFTVGATSTPIITPWNE